MLKSEVQMKRGKTIKNNTGIKGTWDEDMKRSRGKEYERKVDRKRQSKSSKASQVESDFREL